MSLDAIITLIVLLGFLIVAISGRLAVDIALAVCMRPWCLVCSRR